MRHFRSRLKLFRRIAPLLSLALLTAAAASAQDWNGRGRAQGQVVDLDTKEPLEGVMITLKHGGAEGQGPPPFYTDKKGRWSYLGCPACMREHKRHGYCNQYAPGKVLIVHIGDAVHDLPLPAAQYRFPVLLAS